MVLSIRVLGWVGLLPFWSLVGLNALAEQPTLAFRNAPAEILEQTLSHLSLSGIARASKTNRHHHDVIVSPEFYRHVVSKHSIYEILREPLFRPEGLKEIATPAGSEKRIRELLDPNTEFSEVPAGKFKMGTPTSDHVSSKYHRFLEHWVHLNAFKLQKKKVTQLLWYLVMSHDGKKGHLNPSYFNTKDDCARGDYVVTHDNVMLCASNPVESVSWEETENVFIPKVRSMKILVRLATEAEWERAARGLDPNSRNFYSPYYFGFAGTKNSNLEKNSWFFGNAMGHTHAVGQKGVNSLGLYDMVGNIADWVSDWHQEYDPAPDESQPLDNPKGPSSGTEKVNRGGSWKSSTAEEYRSDYRAYFDPREIYYTVGVRLVHE